jgi:serine/threonine protein kinase
MAPEQFAGARCDEKVDVYALATILNECATRRPPWRDFSNAFQVPALIVCPPRMESSPFVRAPSFRAETATRPCLGIFCMCSARKSPMRWFFAKEWFRAVFCFCWGLGVLLHMGIRRQNYEVFL